ncbi:hypothetical protein BKA61DRAFT_723060 [Leptodontidium sp. MPI-SDFR-AT-0119]|nr:hypothetical protein BKA61DRAFT_723060 [Leptodontidium sp. MPI-SDFR-AT-0119]
MYSAPTSSQAAQIIRQLESDGLSDYQLSGPTIEDVFLYLADEIKSESSTSVDRQVSPDRTSNEKKVTSAVLPESGRTLDLHTGKSIGFFRQVWVLFKKRYTILRRNCLPYITAFLLPIIAAGLVTLFLKDFTAIGCSPEKIVELSDVESLASQRRYDLLVGPSLRFSNATLTSLYGPLLPSIPSQKLIQQRLHMNYANVIPAGFFVGSGSSETTLAYKGNGNNVYAAIFGQNIMDVALTNISIGTQYAAFDRVWAPRTEKTLQLVVYLALVMSAYPGFFSLYPTIERTRHIRGLEYSNGVRSLPLWLAYLTFDFLIVLVSSALSVMILAVSSSAWYHVGYLFVIFLLYELTSILLGYIPVNKIDDYLLIVHFVISLVTPMGSLIRALFVALNIFSTTCDGKQLASNPGGILQYGGPILYLIIQVFVLFGILLWYDSGSVLAWYRRLRKGPTLQGSNIVTDEEITKELARVSNSNDGLRVLNLTKSFGPVTAVDNLTFGIRRGEVFALLGPNGAGKSATISLIRGDIQLSKNGGNIFVENIKINKHRAQARSHLGVCPQYDAMDQMTVVEHLQFYARVRGVPDIEHNVREVIRAVGLESFSSRMAAKLSGGNKRKLSLGIALIRNPTVLLLDEPSSGMDAAAKRVMWKTLAAVVPGRSLLLTTHSMEEADALADRAGIMAKSMLAMGITDGLRQNHGNAYYIHLVMKSAPHTAPEEIEVVKAWIMKQFPHADIEDQTFHGQIRFSVPKTASLDNDEINGERDGVGSLIMTLEDCREELGLEHYSRHNVEEEGYTKPTKKKWFALFSKK